MANTQNTRSNVIPFPVTPRVRDDKDQVVQEIADIFRSARPTNDDRMLACLERMSAQLERIAQSSNA